MAKTATEIKAMIGLFTTNRDALKTLGHDTLMEIFLHAAPKTVSEDCGGSANSTLAYTMIQAMPTSWAEQALAWFGEFTPIRIRGTNHGLDPRYKALSDPKSDKYVKDKDERQAARDAWWKLSEATENPFYDFAKEREIQLIGADKVIGWNVAQAKAWQKKIDDNKVKPDAIPAVKNLIAALNAMKISLAAAVPNDNQTQTDKEQTAKVDAA